MLASRDGGSVLAAILTYRRPARRGPFVAKRVQDPQRVIPRFEVPLGIRAAIGHIGYVIKRRHQRRPTVSGDDLLDRLKFHPPRTRMLSALAASARNYFGGLRLKGKKCQ